MPIPRKLTPYLASLLTSPRVWRWRRGAVELRRRLSARPHQVHYFHQVDDPYSHLAAQTLHRLCELYDVTLVPVLVGPPADSAAPERDRLEAFARKDAADIAPHLGLVMPLPGARPDAEQIALANQIVAAAIEREAFLGVIVAVGAALWSSDGSAMQSLATEFGQVGADAATSALERGDRERAKRGHYFSAMFHYGGEWYWGVDRLSYLEQRLTQLGARSADADAGAIVTRGERGDGGERGGDGERGERGGEAESGQRITLELFFSARSPYSYIVLEPVMDLARRLPVDLVVRPVLPMVMRGLAVPRSKKFYILTDSKREADRLGVPFGHVCDPLGRPVERLYSLVPFARSRGRDKELLLAFTRAAWAEGVDTGSDAGMKTVVERAGLRFDEARAHLDQDNGWRSEVETNRADLLDLGLWGVPCFRIRGGGDESDFVSWGQDRLWLVEAEIRKRLQ